MKNKYNSNYERFKTGSDETDCDSWNSNSKYEERHKSSKSEANREFWKIGGTVALIMSFFLILIIVAWLLL